MLIQGQAGTGKSFLIKCLQQLLGTSLKVGAFTAQAAKNIGGETLHKMLSIVPGQLTAGISDRKIDEVRKLLAGVKYFILDEYSMIGCEMLSCISSRLQSIANNDEPFGGYSFILVGDLK